MISENTKEAVTAEAAGKTLGRPAAFDEVQAADVVDAYAKGTAVKALPLAESAKGPAGLFAPELVPWGQLRSKEPSRPAGAAATR